MKLWVFIDPDDDRFAPASRIGTWVKQGNPPRSIRVQPLIIQWEPGAIVVGDFTWVGSGGDYIAKRSVVKELLDAGFHGFEPGPVEIVPNRDHKQRKRNLIHLPYEGPEVVDFWVTKWVPFDRDRTTVRIVREEYGKPVYALEGVERVEHGDWHPETGVLDRFHIPRSPGMGLYVDSRELGECDIFKVNGLGGSICCTDRFHDFALTKGYTNIAFSEVGETVE